MKLARFLVFLSVCFGSPMVAFSQLDEIQTKQPNVITGSLFTLRMLPSGNKFQIYVIGNQIGEIKFSKLKLKATMRSGGEIIDLNAERGRDHFLISIPFNSASGTQSQVIPDSQLNLRLQYKGKSEKFDLKLDTIR